MDMPTCSTSVPTEAVTVGKSTQTNPEDTCTIMLAIQDTICAQEYKRMENLLIQCHMKECSYHKNQWERHGFRPVMCTVIYNKECGIKTFTIGLPRFFR